MKLTLLALILTACAAAAYALEPGRMLSQYHRQIFLPDAGTPIAVTALAESGDGYIWVGTAVGLFRFDGATFEPMPSLGGKSIGNHPIRFLYTEPGGGLWISYRGGYGGGYFKQGQYVRLGPEEGWNSLDSVVAGDAGIIWAIVNGKLVRVENLIREDIGAESGLPDLVARRVTVDKGGTVWLSLSGERKLMYLRRGEKRFQSIPQPSDSAFLATAPEGTIFLAGQGGLYAIPDPGGTPAAPKLISQGEFGSLLINREGGLLATTVNGLVWANDRNELLMPGGAQQLKNEAPMRLSGPATASPIVSSMLEDREGNIWVATNFSLERFRSSRFTPIRVPGSSFPYSVVAGDGGAVWASNWNSDLLKIEGHRKITVSTDLGPHISVLYRDRAGFVWAASSSGIWRSDRQGVFSNVPVQPSLLQPWVTSMTLDMSGKLWLTAGGLVRGSPENGQWQKLSGTEGFGVSPLQATMADALGRVWLSSGREIVRVDEGRPNILASLSKAVRVGAIQAFSERGDRVWIAGLDGIAVVRGNRVLHLKVREGPAFSQVVAIVETAEGSLWVRSVNATWHVKAGDLRQALGLPEGDAAVEAERFDALDGLDGIPLFKKNSLTQASDGLMWFGTNQGVAWIDPNRVPPDVVAPVRYVTSVTIDGRSQATPTELTIPTVARRLEIGYTAIELGYPERIRFRYKLEGFDLDWRLAGVRRVAYYDDLPPGDYLFRVSSTDRSGRWQTSGDATLRIRKEAAWFQTWWFRLLGTLLLLGAGIGAYRIRMRHVAWRLRSELRQQLARQHTISTARQEERDRIARELHDTLLQGVYGLIWKFQAVVDRIPPGDPLRANVEAALDMADRALVDGRARVMDLRAGAADKVQLIDQLTEAAEEMAMASTVEFAARSEGTRVPLHPEVHTEVLALATEALRNAYRHSNASRIELLVDFGPQAFCLEVRDYGSGISSATWAQGKLGHWGLAGMRERARILGASLRYAQIDGGGTAITLLVPAARAYLESD